MALACMDAGPSEPAAAVLSDAEFNRFQQLLHRIAGISLQPEKKALVCSRLARRLRALGLASYGAYFELLTGACAPAELQVALDLLTTNETYFFREPRHFEFLREQVRAQRRPGRTFRVWSAACSSGEEPYSIAMVLADALGGAPWEVLGSDISRRVLERARTGHYPMQRLQDLPPFYLREYCRKGVGAQDGTLLVDPNLRERVGFVHLNLCQPLSQIGLFDAIFLRNVMIYFDLETRRRVVARVLAQLQPGGHLFIGHSEGLHGISDAVTLATTAVYRKA